VASAASGLVEQEDPEKDHEIRARRRQRDEGGAVAGLCEGRVVIVTGAGRGIGREHALLFAREGAKVVVNDLGAEVDGTGSSSGPAGEVVDAIRAEGGEAVANGDDVADWAGSERLVRTAIETFGRLDVVVNNAGILRDRMLVSMTEQDWDAVMRVHLKGTFCVSHHAAVHWRELAKAGQELDARIINTSSPAGLYGNVGQTNYAAAKAGLAAFTLTAAAELRRYGVTVNAIAPVARTRMTESLFADAMARPSEGFDRMDPVHVATLVVWLASPEAKDVTGRVFEVGGGSLGVAEGWRHGPRVEQHDLWKPGELGPIVQELLAKAAEPVRVLGT
jgi:NAD(P)-dependent dehydrogenase (short-subunit alcohol dehydrogenase family)